MMGVYELQYKKDGIKEKIDVAALEVFAEKGYKGAKISDIGERAGVSVGNIYRYYNSKADIFYENIGEDFIKEAKRLLAEKIAVMEGKDLIPEGHQEEFWLANEEVISFMLENRHKMIIVFGRSEGTVYENAKEEQVSYIIGKVGESIAPQPVEPAAAIVYRSLIDMVLNILSASADHAVIREHLHMVNMYHLFGITGLLSHKAKKANK